MWIPYGSQGNCLLVIDKEYFCGSEENMAHVEEW